MDAIDLDPEAADRIHESRRKAASEPSKWTDIVKAVKGITPRVGNGSCSAVSQVFQISKTV